MSGESHATHHAQRVVAERNIGIERRGHDAIFQIVEPSERIDELSQVAGVETDGKGVDGEIAAALIVVERAVFYNRLARIVGIALFACPHKFDFLFLPLHLAVIRLHLVPPLHLCRAEIAEHTAVCSLTECFGIGLCGFNARADHHHVDVFRRTFEDIIANVAAHDVAFEAESVDGVSEQTKVRGLKMSNKFFLTGNAHGQKILCCGWLAKSEHTLYI